MLVNCSPDRPRLRRLLAAVLPTDADFQAFCSDYFAATSRRFANGMDGLAKTTLLLELEDASALVEALKRYDLQRFAQHQHLLGLEVQSKDNPYRGLDAFQLDDAHLYFGREALTERVWRRFRELYEQPGGTRLLAILGPSGSGKSSVARAGLLAKLERQPVPGPHPVRRVVLKPGEHPLSALALALLPAHNLSSDIGALRKLNTELSQPNRWGEFDGLTLWAAYSSEAPMGPLVVLVDQFEEVYTLCKNEQARDAFVRVLLHSARDTARHVSVVLTLRSDFLGETQRRHPELNRLVAEQTLIAGAMSAEEMRRAIVEPAARCRRQPGSAAERRKLKGLARRGPHEI